MFSSNPHIASELAGLRRADLLAEAGRARLAPSHSGAGRGLARALRGLADRLDPGLDADCAPIA